MSGDCALRRGDKVINVRTRETGTVVRSDGLTVSVTGTDGKPAQWAHDDVTWAEGALAAEAG